MKEKLHWPQTLELLAKERGLSNPALGAAVHLSHVTIGNYLGGQLPKGEHLLALADFFGVSTDSLLGRAEPNAAVLREVPDESLVDDALQELASLKEQVAALERALLRLRRKSAGNASSTPTSDAAKLAGRVSAAAKIGREA